MAELDAEIREDSAAMACLQQLRILVDHVIETAYKLNASRMEDSAAMALFQPAMGLIYHVTGDVNAIFDGDRGGCGVGGGRRVKSNLSRHGWMSHRGKYHRHHNYFQQQREHWSHLRMRRGGVQEFDFHISCHFCHYFPFHHQI